jgi:hypothetical protein
MLLILLFHDLVSTHCQMLKGEELMVAWLGKKRRKYCSV